MINQTSVQKQRGFSLIEALVAFLILSVGMLGIASLQTLSLKAGSTAMYRTAAVMKADEIIESMRANQAAVVSGAYAADTSDPGAANNCRQSTANSASVCSVDELATDDIFHWKNSLKTVLPNNDLTTASVAIDPAVAPEVLSTVTIAINWSERNVDTNNAAVSMNYTITLQI
jgi:type IV pilus assembly protein PilV